MRGGCPWECGDKVAAKRCISGYDWGVWRGSGVLAGYLSASLVTGCSSGCRATCGGHAHEVCGVLRAVVACPLGVWGLGVRHGVVSGGGARRPLCHYSDCLDGRLA